MAFDWSQVAKIGGQALSDVGYGLTQGNNIQSSLQAAGQRTAQMAQPRAQAEIMQRQEQERLRLIAEQKANVSATAKFLADKGYGDLSALAQSGYGKEALGQYFELTKPKGKNDLINAGDGNLYDPNTGTWVQAPGAGSSKPPTVQEFYDTATGMPVKKQWNASTGTWEQVGGTKAPPASVGELSATETKQLFDTEETIQAANNVLSALDTALNLNKDGQTRAGFGSDALSTIGANLPDWVPFIGGNDAQDANTMQLKNIVTEQALSQLKLTFGAAPTEGERQILLDIQGSVDQPREVRERIYKRAKELAVARLKFNEERKKKIETGGYGIVTPPPSGGVPTTGGRLRYNRATGELE